MEGFVAAESIIRPNMYSTVSGMAERRRRDLEDSSEEGSWVGEASQPVAGGVALVYPPPQLVQTLQQVSSPGTQSLQTGVCLQPGWGDLHAATHITHYQLSS